MNIKNITLLFALLIIAVSGCYKEPDFTNFNYETYNRIVGPLGGTVNFYANYENDSYNNIIVSLNVPSGALDSVMVFNMYQFEDYELVLQMESGFAKIGSKFLYFVPFYESDGYHEREQLDLGYHLSVEFNKPITVTYNILSESNENAVANWQEAELYHDYYKSTNQTYQLYRIKIPKVDEWGENNNIYVNWNRQGYPDGYDQTDLNYIVNGLWSPLSEYGKGNVSLENWEKVDSFTFDNKSNIVTFQITNTDYAYVIARKVYLSPSEIPGKILALLARDFPLLEIDRASFDGENFLIYFSDKSYATFSKSGVFDHLTNEGLKYANLPGNAQTYIDTAYKGQIIKKITQTQYQGWSQYEVILGTGIKLYFDGQGQFTNLYQFGYDAALLPQAIHTHLQQNFPGELITNVIYEESYGYGNYTVYLSSNIKVYYEYDGSWSQTLYYKMDEVNLPEAIRNYFTTNYPNINLINAEYHKTIESTWYEVQLIDNKWFRFDENSLLTESAFPNLKLEELPTPITNFIGTNYPNKGISEISYYSSGNSYAYYDVYFDDKLNIEFDPSGSVNALYGNNRTHVPLAIRTFIDTTYANVPLEYCYYSSNLVYTYIGNEYVTNEWELVMAGDLWLGLNSNGQFVYSQDYTVLLTDLPARVSAYITSNYQGATVYSFTRYNSVTYKQFVLHTSLSNGTNIIFSTAGDPIAVFKSTKQATLKSKKSKEVNLRRKEIFQKIIDKGKSLQNE